MDWRDPDGKALLVETRNMTFSGDAKLRTIDFQITLTAASTSPSATPRKARSRSVSTTRSPRRKGAKIVDADGRAGMLQVWGKRSNWVDYTAELEGERLGVAIFDHPQEPAQSHLLARARLRPVRAQSVWPQCVRPEAGREPVEAARGSEACVPVARSDSPGRCTNRPRRRPIQGIRGENVDQAVPKRRVRPIIGHLERC